MLAAAVEIVRSVVRRLASGSEPTVTPVSFAVMLVTLGINLGTLYYERRVGRRLQSEILLVDAAHTSTDVFVSVSVLGSLVGVALGVQWLDVATAIAIVGLIGVVAFQILRRTAEVLVDGAATNPLPIQAIAAQVSGVTEVTQVRSRGPQGSIHVDVDVNVDASMTAEHSHAIASEIERKVKERINGVGEVEVHFTPSDTGTPDYMLVSRAAADALGMNVHEIVPVRTPSGTVLDMHVELDGALSLQDAHHQVSELERRVRTEMADVVDVVTHIEPAPSGDSRTAYSQAAQDIRLQVMRKAYELYPDANWHDIRVREIADGYALSLHCHLPGSVTLDHAHQIAENVETQIRADLPQITRVTIHTEPRE